MGKAYPADWGLVMGFTPVVAGCTAVALWLTTRFTLPPYPRFSLPMQRIPQPEYDSSIRRGTAEMSCPFVYQMLPIFCIQKIKNKPRAPMAF